VCFVAAQSIITEALDEYHAGRLSGPDLRIVLKGTSTFLADCLSDPNEAATPPSFPPPSSPSASADPSDALCADAAAANLEQALGEYQGGELTAGLVLDLVPADCLTAADPSASDQTTPPAPPSTLTPPTINTMTCTSAVQTGGAVACTVEVSGLSPANTQVWSAPGGQPEDGQGQGLSTSFAQAGTPTITFTACNRADVNASPADAACVSQTRTVTVTAPPNAPTGSISCSPLTLYVGDSTTCTANLQGAVTGTTWSAPNGSPSAGTAPSLTTRYTTTGTQTVTLQACNGSACNTFSATLELFRRELAALNLRGTLNVTEQDIDCAFSAMPSTPGTISITVNAAANPTDTRTVSGTLSGGGSGSRSISCSKGTASESWTANYSGNFSGTVDPRTGTITITDGQATITQSATYSNCKDLTSATAPCPPAPTSGRSYNIRFTNSTITIAGNGASANGGGGLTIDTGCNTVGTWRVSSS